METLTVKQVVKMVVGGVIALFLFVAGWQSYVIINPGQRGILIQLGKTQDKVLEEGLNFKTPFVQSVKKIDVKTQVESVSASAASKDLQVVSAVVALNFHLDPSRVNTLWQSVGSDYKIKIIDPAIQEAVKAVTSKFTAEELITKRSQVKDDAKLVLAERLNKEFIIVDELSIVNFDFSKSFNEAIESKVTAEQNALASKNKLEQVKYEAEQRVVQAKGEAEAIKIQAEAIQSQGGEAYVDLKAIEKWNGTMPTYVGGGTIPFINIK